VKQKIAVISLSTNQPMAITAIYEEHTLVMSKAQKLPKGMRAQLVKLTPYVEALREQDFKVLVDEATGKVANAMGGNHVSLKTRGSDGRAALITGIECYNELLLQDKAIYRQVTDYRHYAIKQWKGWGTALSQSMSLFPWRVNLSRAR